MRVLIAEDDPVSRRVLQAFLVKWGYEVIVARDGVEAWTLLQSENAPQLLILDWMMPGLNGLEICERLRNRTGCQYAYVLLLTAKGRKEDIVEGIEAGADDYLTKPFDSAELKARLRAAQRVLDLQQELISARDALKVEATHDALTNAWNRRAIFDLLRKEFERAQRENHSLAIVMSDIDHFKKINDTMGHLAGDIVLREVATRLVHAVRPYDSVGRYGGEEFLILVPGCNTATAAKQAERLLVSVSSEPVRFGEQLIYVTISAGVASTADIASADCDAFLHAADTALYRAKNARNAIEVAVSSGIGYAR